MYTKKCKACNKEFLARRKKQGNYCSIKHIVECENCGKINTIHNNSLVKIQYKTIDNKILIKSCEGCNKLTEQICIICNKTFVPKRKDQQKYCSKYHTIYCNFCKKKASIHSTKILKENSYPEIEFCGKIKKCKYEKVKKTNIEKYGVAHAFQSEEVRTKMRNTMIKKYGAAHPLQVKEIKQKAENTLMKNYGVINPTLNSEIRKKADETIKEKYGVDNAFQSEEIKQKIAQTNFEKYGHENGAHGVIAKEKIKKTNLERYGAEHALQSPIIQEKAKKTNLEKYGVEYVGQSEEIKAKIIQTNLKKYGAKHPFSSENWKLSNGSKKVSDKIFIDTIINWKNKYGHKPTSTELSETLDINSSSILERARNLDLINYIKQNDSHLELKIKNFLDLNNIKYIRSCRSIITPLELDFYIPEHNLAIEVNDFITHNSTYNPYGGEPKSKDYHFNKTKLCREKGIRLIHAWENEIKDPVKFEIIKNMILHACGKSQNKIYARNTRVEVRPAITMKEFFSINNISGYRGAKNAYVLVDNKTNEDLMCYLVGYCHFGKGKYDAEIIRGASKLGYSIIGGASKLWKYIINNTDYNSIVYYVDLSHYDGNSMIFLDGVELISEQISFKNYWVETGEVKNREPSRHKEIKELEKQNKVWTLYDAGTQTNVWKRN